MPLDTPDEMREIIRSLQARLVNPVAQTIGELLATRANAGDLSALDRDTLCELLETVSDFVASRVPGRPKVEIRALSGASPSGQACMLLILNDDKPFLVDSITGELQELGLSPDLLVHPTFKRERTLDGSLVQIIGHGDRNWSDGTQESLILAVLPALDTPDANALVDAVDAVLADVDVAVNDWSAMLERLDHAIGGLGAEPPDVLNQAQLDETLAFCRWLRDGNFTFLGMRDYKLNGNADTGTISAVSESGLGVLRDENAYALSHHGSPLEITPEIRRYIFQTQPLIITKSSLPSRVHRRGYMDYVAIKTYEAGQLSGELRIVGLFTSSAYTAPPGQIPLLREKSARVLDRSGFAPGGHDAKALSNIIDTFPRDELFRIGDDLLFEWTLGILDLDLRPRVRVFGRRDRFDRFVSALVFVPRDRYTSRLRIKIGDVLASAFDGHVSLATPFFPEGALVRVHFIIGRNPGVPATFDIGEVENAVVEATKTWPDRLQSAINATRDLDGHRLSARYNDAFPAGYVDLYSVARAIEDIARIERLGETQPVAIDYYHEAGMPAHRARAAIYRFDAPIPLSERVPLLENFGFTVIDERSYEVSPRFPDGVRTVVLHDVVLERSDQSPIQLDGHDRRLEDAFTAVFDGRANNDSFNRLVMVAGATWREAALLRTMSSYLRQVRAPFSPGYIADALVRYPDIAREFIRMFQARFDPDRSQTIDERIATTDEIRHRINAAIGLVEHLDDDRIMRRLLNLMLAIVRTNYFQFDAEGSPPETITLKIDSAAVDDMPEPKPFREIFVASPRCEGIHLRLGAVARGGIRWSDRAQDFRTEVLGLCKAQQVKNTVIVPTGSKGGFVPRAPAPKASREDVLREGRAAYHCYIRALLSVTDDLDEGVLVPPERVVRHDGDDPYLVVAADKGTATFSDDANAIANSFDFWLGDAFASGGSAGYDHKKMGITARGAWESVKRHFREMDIDIYITPFTVIGVGDMSGDVFGNGMLLSRKTRLIAAFDHRDIFIDPDPDPEVSFSERARLFQMQRSSWQDYDRGKLSAGGGVFPRTAKSIELSEPARAALGIKAARLAPSELISAILAADADLLWFGGIGTYVRASTETDDAAGDRANDGLRITADTLRVKVIGEGANLGITQRGRIEAGRHGIRLNADFIDNSAGVNASDQEVNIKIALRPAVRAGRLSEPERLKLLEFMTDDVAAACLANTYQQSLAISLADYDCGRNLGYLARLMRQLEERGLLHRRLEALPDDEDLERLRATGEGLTRPELSVLLSWAKIGLKADLIESSVPDDDASRALLWAYFPPVLHSEHTEGIAQHRLGREIIATLIANIMVNRGGPAVAVRLADETGRSISDIAHAFLAARHILDLPALWCAIDNLDGGVPGGIQLQLYASTRTALVNAAGELLRQPENSSLAEMLERYCPGMAAIRDDLPRLITPAQADRAATETKRLTTEGVPEDLAFRLATLDLERMALLVPGLAADSGQSVANAAKVFFGVADGLHLSALGDKAAALSSPDYYDRLAVSGAMWSVLTAARAISLGVLADTPVAGDGSVELAYEGNGRLGAAVASLRAISEAPEMSVSRLTVVAQQLRDLAGG